MAERKKVIVKINGHDYTVIGEESEEYIRHLASYVDEKVRDIISKNSKFGQTMAAILAAFTITDEYYKTYVELENLKESVEEPLKELETLKKESETNTTLIDRLMEERDRYRDELKKIKNEDKRRITQISKYENALKLKEKELEESQQMINQLQNKLFENQLELVQTKKELDELIKMYDK